jgi:release factor glutamine methyltransferase
MQGDLFTPLSAEEFFQSFDMIVCNPPYISSAKVDGLPIETGAHEPRLAFDGGNFGVAILSRLIKEAPRLLKPESWLCFEVGLGQGSYFVRTLGKMTEFGGVETFTDSQGEIRAIAAVRK